MSNTGPLLPYLPNATKAFDRKYNKLAPVLAGIPEPIVNSLRDFDMKRVNRGVNPLSSKQTAGALATAIRGQAFTPPPERPGFDPNPFKLAGNLISNARDDLGQIVGSVPRIPRALWEEAKALPQTGQGISEALEAGSPSQIIAQLSEVPGVRLLPGAFTAGNIARGEGEKVITNPLMTALDILPLARATAPGRAATAAIKNTPTAQALSRQVTSIKSAAIKTAPGQLFEQTFLERGTARAEAAGTAALRRAHISSPAEKLRQKYADIPDADMARITQVMQTTPADIAKLPAYHQSFIADYKGVLEDLTLEGKRQGLLTELDGEIYDASTARRILNTRSKYDKLQANIPEVIRRLEQVGDDPRAVELIAALQAGDIPAARKLTVGLSRRNVLNRDLRYGVAEVNKLHWSRRATEVTPAPDRYTAYAQSTAKSKLAEKYSTTPDWAKIQPLIEHDLYSMMPGLAKEAADLTAEIAASWQNLKAAGVDPVFVHRVTPGQAQSIDFPRVFHSIRKPSSVKRRTSDITPHVQDARVAISHQGLEYLGKAGSEEFANQMLLGWGRKANEAYNGKGALADEYLDKAIKLNQFNPQLSVKAHLLNLMKKDYTVYDPRGMLAFKGGKMGSFGEEIWMPNAMVANIKRMHDPKTHKLTAPVDQVLKVFRTSLLPLSPRWHFNNIFGGGIQIAVENPTALLFLAKARKAIAEDQLLAKAGQDKLIPEKVGVGTGFGDAPREVLDWNKATPTLFQYSAGKTLGKWYDATRKARDASGKFVEKSYALNAWFDDTYRAAAYLSGSDKALRKGMTASAAQEAGIRLTRKIFQRWDEMTPIERSVIRYVFPFYGWTSHVMQYALKYPFDHPYRAAIMGSLARNEVADMGDSMPERFLNTFFLGNPDKDGNVKTFAVGGLNPFRDVANMTTLTGALGATNPLVSIALQQAGFDPMSGGPELFPNVQYDPETGRLAAKQPGLIQTAIGSIIPQSQILTGLASKSSEFRELMKTNPEAAGRLLMSQAGLPVLLRSLNPTQEQIKGELARQEDTRVAKSDALKGNDAALKRYPGLAPLIEQVRALQEAGQLARYAPNTQTPSPASSFFAAATGGKVVSK